MKISEFIASIIISLVLGFIVVALGKYYFEGIKTQRQFRYQTPQETREQVQFLRDSFQMEYYKKMLDSNYIFNHSKIPE